MHPRIETCPQVERCARGTRPGRLYVTDGSMPDYERQQYPRDAPGSRGAASATVLAHERAPLVYGMWCPPMACRRLEGREGVRHTGVSSRVSAAHGCVEH